MCCYPAGSDVPLKEVTNLPGKQLSANAADVKTAQGKAKARELGEKTFLDFKERRLRFRCLSGIALAQTSCPARMQHTRTSNNSFDLCHRRKVGLAPPEAALAGAPAAAPTASPSQGSKVWSNVRAAMKSHMGLGPRVAAKAHLSMRPELHAVSTHCTRVQGHALVHDAVDACLLTG